jgi:hypothetical protein
MSGFVLTPEPERAALFRVSLAALLAGRTHLAPEVTDGITSGQGGQAGASAATTMIQGQAGTDGTQLSVPRELSYGTQTEGGTI